MSPRLLGILGMLGAPFLLIDFLVHGTSTQYQSTSLSGFFSFVYISAWMCSIIGLWKLEATGTTHWGRLVLLIQLFFLTLANVSNIWSIIQPVKDSKLFFFLDLFWPVSNLFMLATAIMVIKAGRWNGWTRYVPLVVALWLPFCLGVLNGLLGMSLSNMLAGGFYSAIAWMLLGYTVYYYNEKPVFSKPYLSFNAYSVE
jgi:hypothetical protein